MIHRLQVVLVVVMGAMTRWLPLPLKQFWALKTQVRMERPCKLYILCSCRSFEHHRKIQNHVDFALYTRLYHHHRL